MGQQHQHFKRLSRTFSSESIFNPSITYNHFFWIELIKYFMTAELHILFQLFFLFVIQLYSEGSQELFVIAEAGTSRTNAVFLNIKTICMDHHPRDELINVLTIFFRAFENLFLERLESLLD